MSPTSRSTPDDGIGELVWLLQGPLRCCAAALTGMRAGRLGYEETGDEDGRWDSPHGSERQVVAMDSDPGDDRERSVKKPSQDDRSEMLPGDRQPTDEAVWSEVCGGPGEPSTVSPESVTRFEVVDHCSGGGGRVLVKYNVAVELRFQDHGRTLKVFLSDRTSD